MKNLRAGRGLGDSIYLQSIARHLTEGGKPLRVASDFPEVFEILGRRVEVFPFTRAGIDIVAHYIQRKYVKGTTQFQDMCISAGIQAPVELSMTWKPIESTLTQRAKASGRPVVCVQLPRAPMGRRDGFGAEILPDCRSIQCAIDHIKGRATVVQIGAGDPLFRFRRIDLDFANETNVRQLIDLAYAADFFIGYPSFVVPLAESFDKPALIFWGRKCLESKTPFIKAISPAKVLHKATCIPIVDDEPPEKAHAAIDTLLQF